MTPCTASALSAFCLLAAGAATLSAHRPRPATDAPWLLMNETNSAPRGLYVRVDAPPQTGQRVAVRQPRVAQAYLADLGVDPGMPLLKQVVASAGDPVCAKDGVLHWPQGSVRALARDRRGRSLSAWQACRVLSDGELLVIGATARSFDSRYFGPIHRRDVIGVYREVVTW